MPESKPTNHEKYFICCKLDELKPVPRTDFMQSVVGEYEIPPREIEEVLSQYAPVLPKNIKLSDDLFQMANFYLTNKRKGARLPNFPRWVNGMYKDHPEYSKIMAAVGQMVKADGKVVVSGEPLDIMRCADTPHFNSCLKSPDDPKHNSGFYTTSEYGKIPRKVVEETPGIVIAYLEDEEGRYKGRMFLHHGKLNSGEDVVVVGSGYGTLQHNEGLVKALKEKGFTVVQDVRHSGMGLRDSLKGKYVGAFTKQIHWDNYTWLPDVKFKKL